MPRLKATILLLSLATACVPATFAQSTYGAVPGSLNFVQGQATLDGQPITTDATATQPRTLRAGEVLATTNGSADVLLAPGALLRVGQDSSVHMVSAEASRTEVRLDQGRANVDVNVIRPNSLLLVDLPNGQTQILKKGLYTFNAADATMRVFNGEAYAFVGSDTTTDVKPVKVKEGHEIVFNGERLKAEGFDRQVATDDLLPWTGPREANAALTDPTVKRQESSAGYAGYYPGAYGFYGPYGYGDPYYAGDYGYGYPYGFWGYPFFGVGFGYWGGGFYGGRIGRPFPRGGYVGGGYAGRGFAGGGFAGGRAFAGGGGFHGGGGGFHGGGGRR